jgi:hypothetical protein
MDGINYPRHFAALALIVILWIAYLLVGSRAILDDGLYLFGAVGALHAATVVIALTAPVSVLRRTFFVAATAVLAAVVPLIGILAVRFLPFDVLESLEQQSILPYLVFGIASMAGALMYVGLIKVSISPVLSWRALVTASILCPVATIIALAFQEYSTKLHEAFGATVAWWLAFSASLIVTKRMTMAANPTIERDARKSGARPSL